MLRRKAELSWRRAGWGFYFAWSDGKDATHKVTLGQRQEGGSYPALQILGKTFLGRRISKNKGPEAGMSWMFVKNRKKTSMAQTA